MRLTPSVQTKPLISCEPGELVKIKRFGVDFRTIIISAYYVADKRTLAFIVLEDDNGLSAPRFHEIDDDDEGIVLSYGKGYEFHIAPTATIVSSSHPDYEANGALIVGTEESAIRIFPLTERNPKMYHLIASGIAKADWRDTRTQLAILEWSIHLLGSEKDTPPFYSFTAKSPA